MVAFHTNFMPLFCLGTIDAKYYYRGIKAHIIMLEAIWWYFGKSSWNGYIGRTMNGN